jgi:hypothetical protein
MQAFGGENPAANGARELLCTPECLCDWHIEMHRVTEKLLAAAARKLAEMWLPKDGLGHSKAVTNPS